MSKKKNHTHKTIFTWFGNLPTSTELQGFHYYQEKNTSAAVQFFFSLYKNYNDEILITKTCFLPPPLHGLNLRKSPIKNHATLFESGRVESSNGSNITRLHKAQQISHLETSSITNNSRNPPKTIFHPCNLSSYPQARRPTKVVHNFSFLIVTPLVNMSVGFLDPQIFSSITSLSSTR